LKTYFFNAQDGVSLAVHEVGAGRPLLLIHGYISDAATNWIKYGHAALLAEAGFRVLMPDLRGHGQSGKPHDPATYPPDILARDMFDLVAALGLADYDLAGYSLGGRTVLRMLAMGANPRRAVIAGMGLEGIIGANSRRDHFKAVFDNLGSHSKGSAGWMVEAFLKTTGGDPVALALVLDSFVDTPLADLQTIEAPAAVICGIEDQDNGSAAALANALPHGRYIEIPGTHMSAVAKPDLGLALRDYLLTETAQ
jgi:pimeloyl-ACP methyl ester carboxylesterase